MPQDRTVDIRGLKIHYLEWGEPGAPPLVAVPGLTQTAHSFDEISPVLARRYRVLAVDVRGRGDSAWGPPEQYTVPEYCADLKALAETLGLGAFTLVGTSLGGVISIAAAGSGLVSPDRIVLNDIGPEVDPAGGARIGQYVGSAPDVFPSLEAATDWFREYYQTHARLPYERAMEAVRHTMKQVEGGWAFKYDPAIRQQSRATRPGAALDLWQQWEAITCPVLVVRGAESDILSPATAERMRTTGPKATVVEVPGIGHAPSLGEPEAVQAIKAFLAIES